MTISTIPKHRRYLENIKDAIMREAAIVRVGKRVVIDDNGHICLPINVTPRLLKKVRPARARQIKRLMKYEARAK